MYITVCTLYCAPCSLSDTVVVYSFVDCPDSCKFLVEMAGAEFEGPPMNVFESMETIDEIEERSLRIDSLYTLSTIYPETLPL